jgi:hypothetical protein
VAGTVDFAEQLGKQLQFLEASCREYDAGNLDEAVRIAQALRVMFHHTGNSVSLLTHLGATGISMLSTAGKRPSNSPQTYWPGVVNIKVSFEWGTVTAEPTFGEKPGSHRMLPFGAWWDGDVIFFASGRRIKRKQLALDVANMDGGAHVATNVPANYLFFLDGAAFSFSVVSASGEPKMQAELKNAHLACLRQIAYEVFHSPDLLKLAGR